MFIPNVFSILKSTSEGGGESQLSTGLSVSIRSMTGDEGGDSSPVSTEYQ